MDPSFPNIDYSDFEVNGKDFEDYYRNAVETNPKNTPRPRGKFVKTIAFLDASLGQNKKNRKPHASYIIFANRAPILWYSKQ